MIRTSFITVITFVSLSIWKIHGQESNSTTSTTSPTSIKPVIYYPYETLGFNSSDVRSGPILLIDKKTIFISNLHYDASDKDTYFWAGKGVPPATGVLVPDENNSNNALKAYQGQNIYLQLSGNITADKIDYLSIWSKQRKVVISYVTLYSKNGDDVREAIPEARGFHRKTEDNKTIFRVPACCELNEMSNCYRNSTGIQYKVYASNETHIDPTLNMTDVTFIPYSYDLKCPPDEWKIALDSDSINGFIFNTSLIYVFGHLSGILLHDQFCMENGVNGSEPLILICVPGTPYEVEEAGVLPALYLSLLIISTVCFFLSALCYLFILKAKDVHQKCFVGYSFSMTVTFFSLIFLQKFNGTGTCGFMGSLFSFSTLSSFVWLTCLCIDLICVVKSYERYSNKTRIYFYIGFSLIIPLIFLIASLIPDGWPDVPKSFMKRNSQNMCDFEDANVAILFTPIAMLLLASLIALVYTSYIINTHDETNDYEWIRNETQFKFMLRSCFLIWVTSLIWLVEAIVKIAILKDDQIGVQIALDLIEASQGIFVAFIFVLNKYTRRAILRVIERNTHKQEREMQYKDLLERLNQNMEPNGTAGGGVRAENEHG